MGEESSVETYLGPAATAFLVVGMFLAGGVLGHFNGYSSGLEDGQENFEYQVENNGFIPDSDSTFVYAQDSIFNRTMGVYFDDADYSYVCDLSRVNETQISSFAFRYDGVECSVESGSVVAEYDSHSFNNTESINGYNSTDGSQ